MRSARVTYVVSALLLGVALVVFVTSFLSSERQTLTLHFLDVGQGDAILIETPSRAQYLVDGGANRSVLRALSTAMPFYDRSIDGTFVTHFDRDHAGGIPDVYERFQVSYAFDSGFSDDSAVYRAYQEAVAAESGVTHQRLRAGDQYTIGDGITIDVLHPSDTFAGADDNEQSLVLKVTYHGQSVLLTGDIEAGAESYLVGRYAPHLKSDVLKVAHHGSSTSSSETFLSHVQPEYAIVSYGCDNRYGHPDLEVVERVLRYATELFHTCTGGTITVEIDHDGIRIKKSLRE